MYNVTLDNIVCCNFVKVKIKYDYLRDIMLIDGEEYPLKHYRIWLINNHESLCNGHFVKAIKMLEKTKFYYDWQAIYFIAFEYQFLNKYLYELSTGTTNKS